MTKIWGILIKITFFITLFTFYECKIHEAFFSGDCKKATAFCKHQCINIDKGFICKCNPGYQLLKDGQSCAKIPDNEFIGSDNIINNNHHLSPVENIPSYHDHNSIHSEANNQISYNKLTLKSEKHDVVIGNHTSSIHKEDVVHGSGNMLPPMSIMRPPTCDGVICQNGGHCVVKQFSTKCNCPLGFGGRYCEKNVPVKYPKFDGDGYLAFPVLTDSYKEFEIQIDFRPEQPNGLILFSGEMKNAESDFFSIALIDGFVEFRYDCGTGMGVLRSKERVNSGQWNSLIAKRIDNKGSLQVNKQDMVSGMSQGAYSRLTLRMKLYMGGYIDISAISTRVGTAKSYVGCIQTFKINSKQYDMRQVDNFGQAEIGQNVGECSSGLCSNVSCKNGGICTATSADQYICLCTLGWAGQLCQRAVEVDIPQFSGHSFVKHPGLQRSSLLFTQIEMVFKPIGREGLVLYNGYTNDRKGDFISLAMREGHLEFQFDLGTGPGVLRSIQSVSLNEWHHVKISRTGLQGILEIDDQMKVVGIAQGAFTQLTLLQDLYIGGHENFDQISNVANLSSSFYGCVQKVIINGQPLKVVSDAIDGINIDNCDHPCVVQPCLNGGECEPDQHTYKCYCPLGYSNTNCDHVIEDRISVPHFNQHSYLMFTDKKIMDRVNGNKIDIQMKIKPESHNGLLVWSGKSDSSSSDYIALGFKDRALTLYYNLGSGEASVIYNASDLFDGQWHSVKVQRDKQDAYIMVDKTQVVEGTSPGSYTILNTNQLLYIGGLPDVSHNSKGKFYTGFIGCIKDVILAEDYQFNLVEKAKSGRNIESCSQN